MPTIILSLSERLQVVDNVKRDNVYGAVFSNRDLRFTGDGNDILFEKKTGVV